MMGPILRAVPRIFAVLFLASLALPCSAADGSKDNIFGVAGHFLHVNRFYPQYTDDWEVKRTLPFVKDLGASWVSEPLYSLTAPQRVLVNTGNLDQSALSVLSANRQSVSKSLSSYDSAGIKVVLPVLLPAPNAKDAAVIAKDFSDWIADLVTKHKCIVAVQLHNEPNLRHFWPSTPEAYVDAYRPLAEKIKQARPDVQIAVGAMSSLSWPQSKTWLRRAIQRGLLSFADAVSVHPYNLTGPPETDPFYDGADKLDPDNFEKAVRAFWSEIQAAAAGKNLKLYFTEFGYSSAWKGLAAVGDEQRQASYLSRLLFIYQDLRLKGLPLEAVFWYDLKDDGTKPDNEQHNYGLLNSDLSRKKPAFWAYRSVAKFFSPTNDFEPVNGGVTVSDRTFVKTKLFRRKSDGALIVAFWRLNQLPGVSGAPQQITIEVKSASVGDVRLFQANDRGPEPVEVQKSRGEIRLDVRPQDWASWLVIPSQ